MMINKGINCIKINFDLNRHFARKTKRKQFKDHPGLS